MHITYTSFVHHFYKSTIKSVGPHVNPYGDLIPTQHHHNNCTTPPHMGLNPTHWAPSPCEGVLCSCCGGVVNLSFSILVDPTDLMIDL